MVAARPGDLTRCARRPAPRRARQPLAAPCDELPRRAPRTRSTCPYCGVGCGVVIERDGDADHRRARRPRRIRPTSAACAPRARTLHLTARRASHAADAPAAAACAASSAARQPQRASLGRGARPRRRALRAIIREHGPDAVGFYVSGQLLTEDYYVFNKLAKGLVGTNNIDTNSRLCMSSAVAGYKQTLGADAPPACYDDIDHARLPLHRRHATPPGRIRSCSAASRTPRRAQPGAEDHRGRPAPHRHRGSRRPAPADPARHRRRAVPRHAAPDAVGRLDRSPTTSPRTRTGFDALKATVRDYTPRTVAQALRHRARTTCAGGALVRHARAADAVACTARA